ncbi:MAG: hypothetical protein PVG49_19835 [Desulfobacteraceae bacterium]|jgi:hypothetical protein
MKPETTGKVKYGIWGLVLGALVAMIVGFSWGGWTTASDAKAMNNEAVLASQAAICVAQFMKDPNHEENLKEFGELDSWKRSDFIEKGGWDKMPGQEAATNDVARACADGLVPLLKK